MNQGATDSQDPFNTKRPEVYKLKGFQWVLFYPVAWLLWLYIKSWRFRISPEALRAINEATRPRLVVIWHNRSLVGSIVLCRYFNPAEVACLVSPSRMAAWEVAFFDFIGLKVIRGSTTRRSVQAGIEILRSMRTGCDSGISPDGPSGPLYSFKEGAVALARKSGASLLLIAPNAGSAWRAKTWDRHLIPLPFAKIETEVSCVPPNDPIWDNSDAQVASELRRVCLEMTKDPFSIPEHE
jgi:lysophospholipid acyltransferase (LPLAT)-like uncharacterized protein